MENPTIVIALLMILAILFLMAMFAKLFRKAGPHEALIVYGFRGTRVVQGLNQRRDSAPLEGCPKFLSRH